jgi:hypothetical protein
MGYFIPTSVPWMDLIEKASIVHDAQSARRAAVLFLAKIDPEPETRRA